MKILYIPLALVFLSCSTKHPVTSVNREPSEALYKKDERLEKIEKNSETKNGDISTAINLGSSAGESSRQTDIKTLADSTKNNRSVNHTVVVPSDSVEVKSKSRNTQK